MSHTVVVLWVGFGLGILWGVIGQRTDFCLTGGLREWLWQQNRTRIGVFALAMVMALIGTQILVGSGRLDLRQSIYLQPTFSWLLIPLGGVIFGYGMILARGCGSRALVLLGDGNLRSLLVLPALGISAYVTLTGLLALPRLRVAEATSITPALEVPSLAALLQIVALPAQPALVLGTVLLAFPIAWFGWKSLPKTMRIRHLLGAMAIGLLIPLAWITTGILGADDFEPVAVESLTFVAPIGDTIQYLMLSTGTSLRFGVAVVAGVLMGSLVTSLIAGDFTLRGCRNPAEILHAVGGGILMGIGGALALGCSVGQGLSGFSTLSLPSLLAFAGILYGARLALRSPWSVPPYPEDQT